MEILWLGKRSHHKQARCSQTSLYSDLHHKATLQQATYLCQRFHFQINSLSISRRYQNCVYTYRILPNEERKLSVQVRQWLVHR